jgi:hypothetical protein
MANTIMDHYKGEKYLGNFYLKQAINVTTQ